MTRKSRQIFHQLVSFRLKYDLELLRGFKPREHEQYFEDFLRLNKEGETFVDVGGYDGATSLEFIRHCPDYRAIHVFEPEPGNYQRCIHALASRASVYCHPMGLAESRATLLLSSQGSGSAISTDGKLQIAVDRLDDMLNDRPTFIKIDVEGAETGAIVGAGNIITTFRPRLAICVITGPVTSGESRSGCLLSVKSMTSTCGITLKAFTRL